MYLTDLICHNMAKQECPFRQKHGAVKIKCDVLKKDCLSICEIKMFSVFVLNNFGHIYFLGIAPQKYAFQLNVLK